MANGLLKATEAQNAAKDRRIAELEAQLAAAQADSRRIEECRMATVSLNRDVELRDNRVTCTKEEWAGFIDRIEAATKQFA